MKIRPMGAGYNSRFSHFCERAWKAQICYKPMMTSLQFIIPILNGGNKMATVFTIGGQQLVQYVKSWSLHQT